MRLDRLKGKRTAKYLSLPELDVINSHYRDGTILYEQALALVSQLRDKESKKGNTPKVKPVTNSENQKLLERYWDREYTYRDISAPKSMLNSLNMALRLIGNTALLSVSQHDLQKKISGLGLQPNKRRRVISRINQLLKFAGRDYRLKLPKQEFLEIKYLTRAELEHLSTHLHAMDRELTRLAFATGCRVGELFGIAPDSVRGPRRIYVGHQVTKDLTKGKTKNGKPRTIRMLEVGDNSLKYWLSLPQSEKFLHRNRRLSDVVKFKAMELWPNKPDKHIKFHDLRHSYAIEMLRLGASLTQVAQLLGDSIQVCQTYYTGFSMVDESLDALDVRIAGQKN